MFLLTRTNYDRTVVTVLGVFNSMDRAKEYAENILARKNVIWAIPAESIVGNIYTMSAGGYLYINPVTLNPELPNPSSV